MRPKANAFMEFLIIETAECLDLVNPMPAGKRILFLLLSLIPLWAPYELILRPRWENYWNPFFLFVAVISAGALAVSCFLVWAAIAGLSTRMKFDKSREIISFAAEAPILPRRTREFPFGSIANLEIGIHEWSDGGPSYSFEVVLRDGRKLSLGSSWSRAEVEAVRDRVAEFLPQTKPVSIAAET